MLCATQGPSGVDQFYCWEARAAQRRGLCGIETRHRSPGRRPPSRAGTIRGERESHRARVCRYTYPRQGEYKLHNIGRYHIEKPAPIKKLVTQELSVVYAYVIELDGDRGYSIYNWPASHTQEADDMILTSVPFVCGCWLVGCAFNNYQDPQDRRYREYLPGCGGVPLPL